jgi:hypothetical protein
MHGFESIDELLAIDDTLWPEYLDRKSVEELIPEERNVLEYWLPFAEDKKLESDLLFKKSAMNMNALFILQIPTITTLHESIHVAVLKLMGGEGYINSIIPTLDDKFPYIVGGSTTIVDVPNPTTSFAALVAPDIITHTFGFLMINAAINEQDKRRKILYGGLGVIYLFNNIESIFGGDLASAADLLPTPYYDNLAAAAGLSAALYAGCYCLSKGLIKTKEKIYCNKPKTSSSQG